MLRSQEDRDPRAERPETPRCIDRVWAWGRWKFFAVVQVDGWRYKGPRRRSIEEAQADIPALRRRGRDDPRGPRRRSDRGPSPSEPVPAEWELPERPTGLLVEDALQAVLDDAERRGLATGSIRTMTSNVRVLLDRYLDPWDRLEDVCLADLREMVRVALEDGKSPDTVRCGYLSAVHRAFQLAGLDSPVPQARVVTHPVLLEARQRRERQAG